MLMWRTGCGVSGPTSVLQADGNYLWGYEISTGRGQASATGTWASVDDVFHSIAPGTTELAMGMKGARPISRQLSAISRQ